MGKTIRDKHLPQKLEKHKLHLTVSSRPISKITEKRGKAHFKRKQYIKDLSKDPQYESRTRRKIESSFPLVTLYNVIYLRLFDPSHFIQSTHVSKIPPSVLSTSKISLLNSLLVTVVTTKKRSRSWWGLLRFIKETTKHPYY